jgi:uncharacterized repeat protein (TIGR03806 family)
MNSRTRRVLLVLRHAVPTAALGFLVACSSVGTGDGGIANPPADSTAPTVPMNVRTSAVTDTSVTIMWDASTDAGSGVAGYRLSRNNVQVGGTITGTQFTDTALNSGTVYTYSVQAVDNAGNVSVGSATAQATTTGMPPGIPTGPSGLDTRPSNTTCVAPAQPTTGASVASSRVFPNVSFANLVLLLQAPGSNSKWYAVEQAGTVRVFDNVNNASNASTYIDLTGPVNFAPGGENGLLGMAFDPDFATNHRVYLSYTADPTVGGSVLESRISRFTEAGGVLNPASEEILLTIPQPFTNHNGGNIVFGPDGLLYAGFGDGGDAGDPNNNSQNRSTLLGKMIRIDVRGNGAYTIPSTNPYSGNGTARCQAGTTTAGTLCQEIYAYGFRNPWRWSFDRASSTPDLWIADVGQGAFEEVDHVTSPGGNYGWRIREGAHCFNPSNGCATTANGAPLIDPVAEYDHSVGQSITGGYVYRGTAIPSMVGRYVFADFITGRVFALLPNNGGTLTRTDLLSSGRNISSFAQDSDGELYFLDYGGSIFKLVPGSSTPSNPIKALLSQTGCMSSTDVTQPASGLIPYAPAAAFWSDGATKARWIALPDGARITVENDGDWTFPNGTVLVKSFTLNGNLIETRLFMRHMDTGNWAGYTYRWNTNHTDANLVSGGLIDTIAGQSWTYPSEAQCLQCHTSGAGFSLGLETKQLNTTFHYPSTNRDANQLATLQAIGMFANTVTTQAPYADPFDAGQPITERARAYLHTNCAQCHRPNGGTPVSMDLRYATAIGSTNTCNVTPTAGDLGVAGARIIAPGNAASSVLYLRMNRRGTNQMPPVASHQVDTQGATLLQTWINGMTNTCQ